MRRSAFLLILIALPAAAAAEIDGHTKLTLNARTFPADSLIRDAVGSRSDDWQGELRLNLRWRRDGWAADAAWQLAGVHGELRDLAMLLPPEAGQALTGLPNDDRRLFDLTDDFADSGDAVFLHRLDRLSLSYSSERTVLRLGRQALSWGRGLFYAPMDLVNPFDPAAIDTEYKPGDDMAYAQFLRANGHDFEAVYVFRRNPATGDVEHDEGTAAFKYHGFAGDWDYELLVAESYGDRVLGFGASRALGGAVWGSDVIVTDTVSGSELQLVTNLTYSWTAGGRNVSGVFEYHYNGFGQPSGRYSPAEIAANPALFARLARGQSFTLGRHYLAASVTIEMTPLWTVTPLLLANAEDPSGLLQLSSRYSLGENLNLLASLNLPLGPAGSEFGGVDSGLPGRTFASGPSLFAQIGWYF